MPAVSRSTSPIADAPPLVKFAAPFGILEAKQGGVLPVTVRGVEPALRQVVTGVVGGTSRIEADDGAIAGWVRRVAKAQENDIRDEGPEKHKVTVNHTGETPLLAGTAGVQPTRLVLPGGGRQFEVVGIPLAAGPVSMWSSWRAPCSAALCSVAPRPAMSMPPLWSPICRCISNGAAPPPSSG